MKNIITLLMVSIFLLTTTSVSADYENSDRGNKTGEKHEAFADLDDDTKAELKALSDTMKEEIAALKETYGEDMDDDDKEELMEKVQEIRDAYYTDAVEVLGDNEEAVAAFEARTEATEAKMAEAQEEKAAKMEAKEELLSELDDDTRTALEALKEEYKAAAAELKEGYSEDNSDDENTEIKEEMTELRAAYQADLVELLEDYPEVLESMSENKREKSNDEDSVKGSKKGVNNSENKGEKSERGEKSSEMKMKYKKTFVTKYQARLENVSDEKLEKVLVKIDVVMEKYEANEEITDEKKEKVLAQLEALAEMIEDILVGDSDLDLGELLD